MWDGPETTSAWPFGVLMILRPDFDPEIIFLFFRIKSSSVVEYSTRQKPWLFHKGQVSGRELHLDKSGVHAVSLYCPIMDGIKYGIPI